jgi:hypothetical protein
MDAMTRQHQQFMANMQQQGEARQQEFASHLNSQTAQAQNFIGQMDASTARTRDYQDVLLNQQYYLNPQTGERATISGTYNHTWANGPMNSNATSIVSTPDPNLNHNGFNSYNWVELMPIHH